MQNPSVSVGKNWIACKIDHSRAVKRVCNASPKLDEGQRVNVGFVCASLSVGVDSLFARSSSPASLFSIPGPILIRPRRRDAAAQSLLCVPFSCTWQTKYYAYVTQREIRARKSTRPDFQTRERAPHVTATRTASGSNSVTGQTFWAVQWNE